jgi:hypothetical protein
MVTSQNGCCSYKLSIHKKTNIMQIMTKNITFFVKLIFYHREVVKLDHFMTLSVMPPLQNPPFCSSTVFVRVNPFLSLVQSSYESGMKELSQEFRVRLQQEMVRREEVESQLEKQVSD